MSFIERLRIPILISLILLAFFLRLYRIDNPIADWHSWRQADTSAVSRNFVDSGFDILHPKFDDLSNVPSGINNPQGYRFVEFPIFNVLQASGFLIFDQFSLEVWGRLVSIFASLSTLIFIYLIVRRRAGERAALLASFFFAVIPFSVYYGRVILPDPLMSGALLGGIYFFDLFLNTERRKKRYFFVASCALVSLSLLLKPYALLFTLPMIYLAFQKYGISFLKKWYLYLFLILSVTPLLLWRLWISNYPEGIPASDWLFNQNNIRFKGAFFYWIFADRLGRLILGYWGIFFFLAGFLSRLKKENYLFFLSFIASSILYITIFAGGNVQHDYYQILIFPSVAIFLGLGADFLLSQDRKITSYVIFAAVTFFTIFFGWYHVRDYFNINNPSIVEAGRIVDTITPKDSQVIAIYNGDTSFLYNTKRKGWASFQNDVSEMVKLGADFLAFARPTTSDYFFQKDYEIIYSSEELLLFDLKKIR